MSENIQDTEKAAGDLTLGSLSVSGPQGVLDMAADIKFRIAPIINEQKLYSIMEHKDRKTDETTQSKHVNAEGWALLGGTIGVVPRTVSTVRMDDGKGWSATVELVRVTDGAVVGRGEAMCGSDEGFWARNDEFARKAMSQTRAASRAYRMTYGWIMKMAGFEATASEEMPEGLMSEPDDTATTPPQPAQEARSGVNGDNPPNEPAAPQGKPRVTVHNAPQAATDKPAITASVRPAEAMDIPTLIAWFRQHMDKCDAPHADKELTAPDRKSLGTMLSWHFPEDDDRHNFQFIMTGFSKIAEGMTYRAKLACDDWNSETDAAEIEADTFLALTPGKLAELVTAADAEAPAA